ncbi:MAG: helix-turn-helix transcriptional regulator [Chloroflexi bacterium]|nr:helix-turn-helix transcriptional regulator [Chloroflexota bacterium]
MAVRPGIWRSHPPNLQRLVAKPTRRGDRQVSRHRHALDVDAHRLGNALRMLRIRSNRTQADVASRAGTSATVVSRIERGLADTVPMRSIHAVALALDAWADYSLRWRGGELDRIVNARHAALHEAVARWLRSLGGWDIAPEVSFAIYGERGIIDVLCWHAATSTLLVIELKTELVDISETLGTFHRKVRVAPRVASDRGWNPVLIAGWLLLADSRTNHRRLADHQGVIRAALPTDGRHVSRWLRRPDGPLMALSFLPNSHLDGLMSTVRPTRRVRPTHRAAGRRVVQAEPALPASPADPMAPNRV